LSEFKQFEFLLRQTPSGVFAIGETAFQEPEGFTSVSVDAVDASTVRVGAARLADALQGEQNLGSLIFWADERITSRAVVEIIHASIGPSSTLRQTFDYENDITVAIVPDIVLMPGPITMDFDEAEGDQGLVRVIGIETSDIITLQLNIAEVDPITGWSANVIYDMEAVEYVSGSFKSTQYLAGLVPLVAERDGRVDVGGAVFGGTESRGNAGSLGTFQLRMRPGYSDSTVVEISQVNLQVVGQGERILKVSATAIISAEKVALVGDFNGDGEVDFSDFFVFADGFGGTRADLDLNGDGEVNFSDFFVFADVFGTSDRAKLLVLAQEYLGLPIDAQVLAYPNPFNASTIVRLSSGATMYHLKIFNQLGQEVKNLLVGSVGIDGVASVVWDGTDEIGQQVGTGLYIVQINDGQRDYMGKLTLIR